MLFLLGIVRGREASLTGPQQLHHRATWLCRPILPSHVSLLSLVKPAFPLEMNMEKPSPTILSTRRNTASGEAFNTSQADFFRQGKSLGLWLRDYIQQERERGQGMQINRALAYLFDF